MNILLVLFSLSLSLTYDWFLNCKCIASMVSNQCMLCLSMKYEYEVCFIRLFASMKILENRLCVNIAL